MLSFLIAAMFVPQKGYAEVTADDVRGMGLNHYFSKDRKGHDGTDFVWTYSGDRFTIKEGNASIPADLIERFLPEKSSAKTISGKWAVSRGRIVFSDIKFDGDKAGRSKVDYGIYRTAPTVIRIGEPQYVFGLIR